jgi:hypothetical protein
MIRKSVHIRAFRAVKDEESSLRFIRGHEKVLEAHGVKRVTSMNHDWMHNPAVFVILVENEDRTKVYGGARVHAAGGTQRLPLEDATGYMDNKVYEAVERESIHGTGELCGLWNSIEVAGLGIGSFFATRAGVTIADQIGIDSMFALCAPYTVRWAKMVGCEIYTEVGKEGTFYYPKLDLVATTVLCRDTLGLGKARRTEQRKIKSLRETPNQKIIEQPPFKKSEVEIFYDLNIPNLDKNEFKQPILPPINTAKDVLPAI